jgi:hypothetical protein
VMVEDVDVRDVVMGDINEYSCLGKSGSSSGGSSSS